MGKIWECENAGVATVELRGKRAEVIQMPIKAVCGLLACVHGLGGQHQHVDRTRHKSQSE